MNLGKTTYPRWEGTQGPKLVVKTGGDLIIFLERFKCTAYRCLM